MKTNERQNIIDAIQYLNNYKKYCKSAKHKKMVHAEISRLKRELKNERI